MDTARIVAPEPSPAPDAPAGNAVWNRPADTPPSEAMLANAEDAARRQRTSPQVRDANGNFLRGEPLGEGVLSDAGEGFVDSDGAFHLVDRDRHVALLDPVSGRWLVFDGLLAHDTYTRGGILPFRRNDRTGERALALPDAVHGPIEAAKLPHDVYSGRVDPRSPEGLERAVNAAGSFTGGPIIIRARPGSVATGLRRPPKLGGTGNYDIVEIKTTPTRSSNAVRGTPEHKALNNPKPNTIYRLDNGETFRTNAYGHLDMMEYRPTLDKRGRNSQQTSVGKQGVEGDVGGHIRGAGQGGSTDLYNLFQQNSHFNNSGYKRLENELKRSLKQGDDIGYVRITMRRNNPRIQRPDAMTVEYEINGVKKEISFKNESGA